jgi:hypothetical protein
MAASSAKQLNEYANRQNSVRKEASQIMEVSFDTDIWHRDVSPHSPPDDTISVVRRVYEK